MQSSTYGQMKASKASFILKNEMFRKEKLLPEHRENRFLTVQSRGAVEQSRASSHSKEDEGGSVHPGGAVEQRERKESIPAARKDKLLGAVISSAVPQVIVEPPVFHFGRLRVGLSHA